VQVAGWDTTGISPSWPCVLRANTSQRKSVTLVLLEASTQAVFFHPCLQRLFLMASVAFGAQRTHIPYRSPPKTNRSTLICCACAWLGGEIWGVRLGKVSKVRPPSHLDKQGVSPENKSPLLALPLPAPTQLGHRRTLPGHARRLSPSPPDSMYTFWVICETHTRLLKHAHWETGNGNQTGEG
jgi:hypothetical protein